MTKSPEQAPVDRGADPVYRLRQAADYLGVTEQTMRQWRLRGQGPQATRIGPRLVGFRRSELEKFLQPA